MNLVGRYERVRTLWSRGWGLPYILDKKQGKLSGFKDDAWWRSPEGIWVPVVAGGIGFIGSRQRPRTVLGFQNPTASGSRTTLALDSAYVAGVGGDAIGTRIVLPVALTLNNVYFFITGYTGTAANVNDITTEIRSGTQTVPDTTALGLIATDLTYNPNSTTGWQNVSGFSASLAADTVYWIIIGDTDGGVTDFATVLRNYSGASGNLQTSYAGWTGAQATNGWSTNPSMIGITGSMVLKFSEGSVWGAPFTVQAASTSNTLQKGLIIDGLTERLTILGAMYGGSSNNVSGVNLWEGTAGPGGSPTASGAAEFAADSVTEMGVMFSSPFPVLSKSTQYRVVFTYSAAVGSPGKEQISTGVNADLRAAMFGGGNWQWTEEVAGPAWSNDTDAWPRMGILVEDQAEGGRGGTYISQP